MKFYLAWGIVVTVCTTVLSYVVYQLYTTAPFALVIMGGMVALVWSVLELDKYYEERHEE